MTTVNSLVVSVFPQQDAVPRARAEFARFFSGLELAEPGIAPVTE
ncbi:SAM-dependent methyltransferase [Micromonospora violae]|nr:SAM-dependent methyltransferase [Micromonospora violae]